MEINKLLPDNVTIVEVGPRDGFQNIEKFIPTEQKIEIILVILASGVNEIQLTSFVHPKAIPQLADASQVVRAIKEQWKHPLRIIGLVPNKRGAQDAYNCGVRDITYVISASEAHNLANVNQTIEKSIDGLREIVNSFPDMNVRLDVATAFGCPFNGTVAIENVLNLVQKGLDIGVKEIGLCDTIGVANPVQVINRVTSVKKICGDTPITLHLHDTRGLGIANLYAGMQVGVTRFEGSVGGLGGCPFAPGAAGNTATEDILNLLNQMGINTGINLDLYMEAVKLVKKYIKQDLTGRMSSACTYEGLTFK